MCIFQVGNCVKICIKNRNVDSGGTVEITKCIDQFLMIVTYYHGLSPL